MNNTMRDQLKVYVIEILPESQSEPWYPDAHPFKHDPLIWLQDSSSKQLPHVPVHSKPYVPAVHSKYTYNMWSFISMFS